MRLVAALAVLAVVACGRPAPAEPAGLAIAVVPPAGASAPMTVRLTAAEDARALSLRHSAYGANVSPPLAWSAVAGAKAYAVILQDPDAPGPSPFVHWLIWNIPGDQAALPEGVPTGGSPGRPAGVAQGVNGADSTGYFGPRPPSGVHHYHFEVFALDAPLVLAPGADLAALEKALAHHVIAKGEVVEPFARP